MDELEACSTDSGRLKAVQLDARALARREVSQPYRRCRECVCPSRWRRTRLWHAPEWAQRAGVVLRFLDLSNVVITITENIYKGEFSDS
jgi:hypothetical protein